jgi:hypothetical protein
MGKTIFKYTNSIVFYDYFFEGGEAHLRCFFSTIVWINLFCRGEIYEEENLLVGN